MKDDIIAKLNEQIRSGIQSECQVVYLLAGIRKIIEQDNLSEQYPNLEFHCNWALHSRLKGRYAQEILKQLDTAYRELVAGVSFHELPIKTYSDVIKISNFEDFKNELSEFLNQFGLQDFTEGDMNNWTRFLYAYTNVVEDCPLLINGEILRGTAIKNVTPKVELANEKVDIHRLYKVSWVISGDAGEREIYVLNSFEER